MSLSLCGLKTCVVSVVAVTHFYLTGSGKIKMSHNNHRHKLGLKTAKRKRNLRKGAILSESFAPTYRTLIQK